MECIFFLCGLLLRAARRKPGEKDDSDEDGDENENPKKATPKKANFAMAESKAAEPKKRKAEPSASEGVLCRPPAPRSIHLCPRRCDRLRASASVRAGGDDAADEDKPLSNLANGFDKADAQERI